MTRDEFMEATVDVWEIPPERASRVDHPAPFPVALPERLIHMNSYEGDLILDPFVGSGTTAVAAVRTGRRYIGYDTDAGYIETAKGRLVEERSAVTVELLADDGRTTDPFRGGWASKDVARWLLTEAGFTQLDDEATVLGCRADTPRDRRYRQGWWSRWSAVRTSKRPGAQRIELLWRAILESCDRS